MNQDQLHEARRMARLIVGFIRRDLSTSEREQLDEWLLASEDNLKLFETLTDDANVAQTMAWYESIDEEKAFESVKQKINDHGAKRKTPLIYLVAAIVAGAFIVFYFQFRKTTVRPDASPVVKNDTGSGTRQPSLTTETGTTIYLGPSSGKPVDIGQNVLVKKNENGLDYTSVEKAIVQTLRIPPRHQYQLILADGTNVWLNAMSSIRYPSAFAGTTREVTLDGEAYFEIAENKAKPFLVTCANMQIRVTGTKFNVRARKADTTARVTLLDGSVDVLTHENQRMLHPSDEAIVTAHGAVAVNNDPQARKSMEWTKGIFSFNNDSLEEIMKQLKSWYGVEVIFRANVQETFSGSISRQASLKEVLDMLGSSENLHFTVVGDTINVWP